MSVTQEDAARMRALAAQLGHPQGEDGLCVGETMHESNIGMTRACLAALALQANDVLLEVGHGNGAHVADCLAAAPGLRYQGLELSALMHEDAARRNAALGEAAGFAHYDGQAFPFPDACFTHAMSVNTLYFLSDLSAFLAELRRVLRSGGTLGLAFADADFMRALPFTAHGFRLYAMEAVRDALGAVGFLPGDARRIEERVPSKARPGTTQLRPSWVLTARAPA
jgi:ubiquinone/menaquinone biosynthesis C-methylase UbiE